MSGVSSKIQPISFGGSERRNVEGRSTTDGCDTIDGIDRIDIGEKSRSRKVEKQGLANVRAGGVIIGP